jgi:hypothetical protein
MANNRKWENRCKIYLYTLNDFVEESQKRIEYFAIKNKGNL